MSTFTESGPGFKTDIDQADFDHEDGGSDQTDPRSTLRQTEQTHSRPWASASRPSTNTGTDRTDPKSVGPGQDRADPTPTPGQDEQTLVILGQTELNMQSCTERVMKF